MAKVAVVGDRESVLGFKAVGFEAFFAQENNEASELIKRLAENNYAVIYVTENIFELCSDIIGFYNNKSLPIIVQI